MHDLLPTRGVQHGVTHKRWNAGISSSVRLAPKIPDLNWWYSDNSMATENEEGIKQTMRRFLLDSINIPELNDGDNLFELGIVNSLFAVQLMTFIEKTFGLEVEMDDLDIENFKSLNAATAFVMKKKGRRNA
jgi:methoxymalonate biosynthesis acyl carrier protein